VLPSFRGRASRAGRRKRRRGRRRGEEAFIRLEGEAVRRSTLSQ